MIRPALLSAIVLLAGCARSEEARYAKVENVQLPALNAADPADDDGLTIGTWQNGLQQDRAVLEFGPVGAPARFSLSCDDRRNLLLLWPGAPPEGDLPTMFLQVGSETRRLAVVSDGGATPMLRATLQQGDPFVRVLTGAQSRIAAQVGDAERLAMPPSPSIGAYVQQCASGEVRGTAVAGNTVEASGSVNVVAGNAATTNAQ
jgi:hypothetical protein